MEQNWKVYRSECCANEQENADLVFGVVTILSGILGTVVGGIFLDYLGSTIRNGFKVCCLLHIICCPHWKIKEVIQPPLQNSGIHPFLSSEPEVQLELLLENSLWLGAVGLAACCVYSIGSNNVSICILVN